MARVIFPHNNQNERRTAEYHHQMNRTGGNFGRAGIVLSVKARRVQRTKKRRFGQKRASRVGNRSLEILEIRSCVLLSASSQPNTTEALATLRTHEKPSPTSLRLAHGYEQHNGVTVIHDPRRTMTGGCAVLFILTPLPTRSREGSGCIARRCHCYCCCRCC